MVEMCRAGMQAAGAWSVGGVQESMIHHVDVARVLGG